MVEAQPSPDDPHRRRRISVARTEIAYVDAGTSDARPIVFLHGNPTSSYLWRNIISRLQSVGRCLAPDLIGMGESGASPTGQYRFVDHAAVLDAWFEAMNLPGAVIVGHDWGSALGFHWARRHSARVAGLAYMEAIVRPLRWDEWPAQIRDIFRALRSEAGEEMILKKNLFVERLLPGAVKRSLTEAEMAQYRKRFMAPGEARRPTLTWPRQIPLDGEPSDVAQIVQAYADWLQKNPLPKLFINADPGTILVGAQRAFCRGFPNQNEVTVEGLHFIQEDSPNAIARALAVFVEALG